MQNLMMATGALGQGVSRNGCMPLVCQINQFLSMKRCLQVLVSKKHSILNKNWKWPPKKLTVHSKPITVSTSLK